MKQLFIEKYAQLESGILSEKLHLTTFYRTGDSSNGDSATSTGDKPNAIDIKADVLFLLEHFKDFNRLREMNKFVNQFPGEHVMVCKDLLGKF